MMTPRERVLCALNHEEPDRVPFFFGTSGVTSMLSPAYEQLKAALGVRFEPRFISKTFRYARIDEEVLQRFHSDGRPLLSGPAPSTLRRMLDGEGFVDEWGIPWQMSPATLYYEAQDAPLRHITIDGLEAYPWPDLGHSSRFQGLVAEAQAIQEKGYAVVSLSGASVFEQIQLLRGMDTWLTDMASDPEFTQALLRKVTDLMKAGLTSLLDAAGAHIDVVVMGDDLGTQHAPIISPRMYRTILKPYHAELIDTIRKRSKAKVFFHSDGNIYSLIPDLIDVGVDLLNPVQVSAKDMGDTARLKREFGKRLSFCGGIDTQSVLPAGSPDDVRQEVRRRFRDLAPGGGFVAAAVHCLQPDVPLQNVYALFDEVAAAGRYPIAL
jgi:uroporphyrinogen decarboxylase